MATSRINMEHTRIKIQTLQSWRFFAFLGIFLSHIQDWVPMETIFASFGVSLFIVLSGFLISLHHYDNIEKTSLKIENCFNFTINKISKIYLLHIITFFIAVILLIHSYPENVNYIIELIINFVIAVPNIFLIQSWINDENFYFSFNGVSWFLSTLIFLYFITIPLLKIIKKYLTSMPKKIFVILLCIIFQKIISLFFYEYCATDDNYFVYIFPPFRIFEYFSGCILGRIFIEIKSEKRHKKNWFTLMEILAILLTILHVKVNYLISSCVGISVYRLPVILIVILVFSFENGFISKCINNKFLINLGNISGELFLFHQIVIKYMQTVNYFSHMPKYFLPILALIISIIISELYYKYIRPKNIFYHAEQSVARQERGSLRGLSQDSKPQEIFNKKKSDADSFYWQVKLQEIWDTYCVYFITILIFIVFAGIMFTFSQTPNFSQSTKQGTAIEHQKVETPVAPAPGSVADYVSKARALYSLRKAKAQCSKGTFINIRKAVEYLNEAIRLQPNIVESYRIRALAYTKLDQYQRAIEDDNEAIRLKPNFVSAYTNRGFIYLLLGKKELGCNDAQKACELGKCQLLVAAKDKGLCR
jgi:peptidoglycan/LPS O-acetylase OafA/YrhL